MYLCQFKQFVVISMLAITSVSGVVQEGDACPLQSSGQRGVCTHLANCTEVLEAALEGISPQVCFTKGTVPIVCCPPLKTGPSHHGASTNIGSSCTVKETGKPGVCRLFADCAIAREAASHGILPQRCMNSDAEPVCCEDSCPPLPKETVRPKIGSKADDYCVGLAEKIYPCQNTDSGWIRGNLCPSVSTEDYTKASTNTSEIPHWVWMGSGRNRETVRWVVAGSLISELWVLTTAYNLKTNPNLKYAQLGRDSQESQIYDIIMAVPNPGFNMNFSWVYNDIGLVQLDRPVTFSRRILPACLHTGNFPLPGRRMDQIGWDRELGGYSKTSMNSISNAFCSNRLPTDPESFFWKDGVRFNQICMEPRLSEKCGVSCYHHYHFPSLSSPKEPHKGLSGDLRKRIPPADIQRGQNPVYRPAGGGQCVR